MNISSINTYLCVCDATPPTHTHTHKTQADAIVVKNKNEEGGLGIYFYKNALAGGDWIIQERLDNAPFLRDNLLPPDAPLSTLRVITASRGGLTPDDPRRQGRGSSVDDDEGFDTGA